MSEYNESKLLYRIYLKTLENGYSDLDTYLKRVSTDNDALQELRENLTFVSSHFFRGFIWPLLRDQCGAAFAMRDNIKVWCAGCSSGKEVYSVLMMLKEALPGVTIELLATDYNQEMLRQCSEGVYSLRTIEEIPMKYWHFTEKYHSINTIKSDFSHLFQFRFVPELRGLVQTRHLNLLTDDYPCGFDLILCRNVIKFFGEDSKRAVQEKLARSLVRDGFLVVSDELEKEGINNPEGLGLKQVRNSCIYLKSDYRESYD